MAYGRLSGRHLCACSTGYHLFEQPVRSWHPASHRTALCVMLPGVGLARFWLFLPRGPLAQAQGTLDPEPHTPSNHLTDFTGQDRHDQLDKHSTRGWLCGLSQLPRTRTCTHNGAGTFASSTCAASLNGATISLNAQATSPVPWTRARTRAERVPPASDSVRTERHD